eukprot:scaffold648052_cov18-Prasinocladus_malaysianus.AAC.1
MKAVSGRTKGRGFTASIKPSLASCIMTGRAQMAILCNRQALGARCPPKPAKAFDTTDRASTCMRALLAQHSHDDTLVLTRKKQ